MQIHKAAVSFEIERRGEDTFLAYALNAAGFSVQRADHASEADATEWAERLIASHAAPPSA